MSISFEISYTVKKCSSERPDHPATDLAVNGGKWAPEPTFGSAYVDLAFGTEFCIHSLSFSASGCASVKIVLLSRKVERGSYIGAGVMPQSYGLPTNSAEVYDGRLPTSSECRKLLQCRSSGADRLAALASQEQWAGLRLYLTPAAGASADSFFLRRLEVNRQPTKQEQEQINKDKLANRAANPVAPPTNAPRPMPPAPSRAPPAAAAPSSQPSQPALLTRPGVATAAPQRPPAPAPRPAVSVQQLPPAKPVYRDGQRVVPQRRMTCECGTAGCSGCGGGGDRPTLCRSHKLLCCLKTSKNPSSKGRLFWVCPVPPNGGLGAGGPATCGFQRWADEAMGARTGEISLDGFGGDDEPVAPSSTASRPAAPSSAASSASGHAALSRSKHPPAASPAFGTQIISPLTQPAQSRTAQQSGQASSSSSRKQPTSAVPKASRKRAAAKDGSGDDSEADDGDAWLLPPSPGQKLPKVTAAKEKAAQATTPHLLSLAGWRDAPAPASATTAGAAQASGAPASGAVSSWATKKRKQPNDGKKKAQPAPPAQRLPFQPVRKPAPAATLGDDTEDDNDDDDAEEAKAPCWPPGKPRCQYDDKNGACYRLNLRHMGEFAHSVGHVRKQARKLEWTGPKGPLFRLLHDNGLKEQVVGCTTRDEMLDVLDLHLGLDLSTRASESQSDARPLDPDAIFTDADETPQAPRQRQRAGPITVD